MGINAVYDNGKNENVSCYSFVEFVALPEVILMGFYQQIIIEKIISIFRNVIAYLKNKLL